jgi:hypothetical protein
MIQSAYKNIALRIGIMRTKVLLIITGLFVLSYSCRQSQANKKSDRDSMYKYVNELIHESSPYLL